MIKDKVVVVEYEGRELRAGRFWTETKKGDYWGWQVVYKSMWSGFIGNDVFEESSLPEEPIGVLARAAAYTLAEKTNTEEEGLEKAIHAILLTLNDTEKKTEPDAEGSGNPGHEENPVLDTPRTTDRVLKV